MDLLNYALVPLYGAGHIYNVEETLIYIRTTQNGGIYPPDTIITQFKFIEDVSNNTITIESSIWNGVVFNRYLDPQGGEIIQFPDNISIYTIFFKRNVGLIKLRYQNDLYLSSTTYELIE